MGVRRGRGWERGGGGVGGGGGGGEGVEGGGGGGWEWQTIVKYTRETLFLHVQPAAGLASQFRPLTRSQASSFWAHRASRHRVSCAQTQCEQPRC